MRHSKNLAIARYEQTIFVYYRYSLCWLKAVSQCESLVTSAVRSVTLNLANFSEVAK